MKNRGKIMTLALVAGLFVAVLPQGPASANSGCRSFPNVSWWQNLSHRSVANYVKRRHGGNWSTYIGKWERELAKVERILSQGKTAIIRSRGIRLKGQPLSDYVGKISQRLLVIRCLATENATAGGAHRPTPNFSKVAPLVQDKQSSISRPVHLARLSTAGGAIEIASYCDGGVAAFRLVNPGPLWSRQNRVEVYDVARNRVISARQLRMANGQTAIFRAAGGAEGKFNSGPVGLRIAEAGAGAEYIYDTQVICS